MTFCNLFNPGLSLLIYSRTFYIYFSNRCITLLKLYWAVDDLQCCISFYWKVNQLNIYTGQF